MELYIKAAEERESAAKLYEVIGYPRLASAFYKEIARYYQKAGKTTEEKDAIIKAAKTSQQVAEFYEKNKKLIDAVWEYESLAKLYDKIDDTVAAQKARKKAKELGDKVGLRVIKKI